MEKRIYQDSRNKLVFENKLTGEQSNRRERGRYRGRGIPRVLLLTSRMVSLAKVVQTRVFSKEENVPGKKPRTDR